MTSSNLIGEKRGEFYYWEELDKGYSTSPVRRGNFSFESDFIWEI